MSYLGLRPSNKSPKAKQLSQSTSVIKDYPTLHKNDFKLSPNGLSLEQQQCTWKKLTDYLQKYSSTMIGFQHASNINCSDVLGKYLDIPVNNCGDPFIPSMCYAINTKAMECRLLEYMAELWHLLNPVKDGDQNESYWGYFMSNGATEANFFALYNARGYLSCEPLLHNEKTEEHSKLKISSGGVCTDYHNRSTDDNAFTPVVFYSDDAHYSFDKAIDILRMNTFHELGSGHFPCPLKFPDDYPSGYSKAFLDKNGWPHNVPADTDGTVYLPSLVKLVTAFVSRGHPPVVVLTAGTAFKGSYENPEAIINQLVPVLKEHNLYEREVHYSDEDPLKCDVRYGFWFHIDGALGAGHLPFLEMAINKGLVDNMFPNGFPVFDFRLPEVMSIAMSTYKWFGCTLPSSIYMTRKGNQVRSRSNSLHIGSQDTTFPGSRNGHIILVLWDTFAKMTQHQLAEVAAKQERVVNYSLKKLRELEKHLGEDLWLLHSPGSLMICFKQPRDDIVMKYSLSCNILFVKSKEDELPQRRRYSRICVMLHVDEKLIDQFIDDLNGQGTFPPSHS